MSKVSNWPRGNRLGMGEERGEGRREKGLHNLEWRKGRRSVPSRSMITRDEKE